MSTLAASDHSSSRSKMPARVSRSIETCSSNTTRRGWTRSSANCRTRRASSAGSRPSPCARSSSSCRETISPTASCRGGSGGELAAACSVGVKEAFHGRPASPFPVPCSPPPPEADIALDKRAEVGGAVRTAAGQRGLENVAEGGQPVAPAARQHLRKRAPHVRHVCLPTR